MKRLGFLIILLLFFAFTGCNDDTSDLEIGEPLINSPEGGGGEGEDDPIPPPGGGG